MSEAELRAEVEWLRLELAEAREALRKIARGPIKPAPDPVAHSWEAYARYWMAAATDMKFIAINAAAPAESKG